MIIDKVENLLFYDKMLPNLKNGVDKLNSIEKIEGSKHEFEGGYLMIQKGKTKSILEGTFETHKKYADVQIVLEGAEEMAWANIRDLTTKIPYDVEKDQERLDGDYRCNILILEGMFYIVFPEDGHKAVSHTVEQHEYLKCVMKILI